jgi:hypothetical protein
MFKKSLLMFFVLILSIIPVASASAINQQELTEQEISEKFDEINSKYGINQRFSDEDATFVKKYAKVAEPAQSIIKPHGIIQEVTRYYIEGSRDVGLSTVSLLGYVDVTSNPISASIEFSMSAKDDSKRYHKSITNEISFTGYGVVGSDGVGIVANKTKSYKADNANYNKYQDSETFYGLIAYYNVSAKTIIEDSNQSLTLQAEITKGNSW